MKLIATYLINRDSNPSGQYEVWITNSELANWFARDDAKKGNITWYPKDVLWNKKPIYKRISVRGNGTKLYIDKDYLKEYDYQIIDEDKINSVPDDYWVLEDRGHMLSGCWNIK